MYFKYEFILKWRIMEGINFKLFNDQTFSDCFINFAGHEECSPGHRFGPAIRPCYIIHFILSGKGKFFCSNVEYDLGENQAFLIEPSAMTFYQADFEDPWHYLWIAFKGDKAVEIMNRIGISSDNPVLTGDREKIIAITEAILDTDSSGFKEELKRQSLLYDFLSTICPDTMYSESLSQSTELRNNNYLVRAIEFIQNNFYNQIGVSDVSSHLGISRNYLFTLFKNTMGHSPSEYLAYCRLNRACHMLDDSALSVENVAYSCGYDSLSVFSKAFKHKYGLTPSAYRKLKYENDKMSDLEFNRFIKNMDKKTI